MNPGCIQRLALLAIRGHLVPVLICPVCESVYPPGTYDRCPKDGSLLYVLGEGEEGPSQRLQLGDVVAGKYELLEEIPRRGGAGRTFRARQISLERDVELRLLPANTITKPADHARFQREVETWGRLRSDHLVRLYDSGFTETNAPYMALEFVSGGSLGARLRVHGPLPLELCWTVAEHALLALEAAHAGNVLHRDLSPEALVLGHRVDGAPHCRLTGFGLAKHMGDIDDDPTAITMTGQVVGNPAYMAPENIMLGVLDPRTDLYALGITLYELVAGCRPFRGEALADMLAAHVKGTPEPLADHRPDADVGLRRFISRLLAKDPEARFQTASEGLASLRSGLAAWPEPPMQRQAPQYVTATPSSRYGWVMAVGAALLAIGAGVGLGWWLLG